MTFLQNATSENIRLQLLHAWVGWYYLLKNEEVSFQELLLNIFKESLDKGFNTNEVILANVSVVVSTTRDVIMGRLSTGFIAKVE